MYVYYMYVCMYRYVYVCRCYIHTYIVVVSVRGEGEVIDWQRQYVVRGEHHDGGAGVAWRASCVIFVRLVLVVVLLLLRVLLARLVCRIMQVRVSLLVRPAGESHCGCLRPFRRRRRRCARSSSGGRHGVARSTSNNSDTKDK